jgi:Spy/CpxP family protein refolding chaperone
MKKITALFVASTLALGAANLATLLIPPQPQPIASR